MRNSILFFSLLLLFLSGCGVLYDKPFPGKGKVLSKIPADLQGDWKSEEVNITISETGFIVKDDARSGKHFRYTLGQNCELKEQETRYVLSIVDTSNVGYRIFFIEGNGSELLLYDVDQFSYDMYNSENGFQAVAYQQYYANLVDSTIVSIYSPTTEQWKSLENYQELRLTFTR